MKKLLSAALCLILTFTLLPIGALAAGTFDVTVTAGENGTITIGDEPLEGNDDTRVSFRSDTENTTITVEANNDGADATPVPITVTPDQGYEIVSITLGDTVLAVEDSIGENPFFTVTKQSFGGRIPASFLKTSGETYVVSAIFQEAAEGPGGGDPSDENYTITLTVGDNGSVTVTRKVAEEDVSVPPDEVSVNTYTVPSGSDVTFTFAPEEGYIIDQLWVDGMPEWADQDNKFTLFNVGRSQPLEVTFMRVEEYTVTVPQVDNVAITAEINGVPVDVNNQFKSHTRDIVRYYFALDTGYKIKEFSIRHENGLTEGVFTNYDPVSGRLYAEVETNFNYTLVVETEALTGLPTPYYAILDSEASGDESAMKAAIRRELGLQGVIVLDKDITIDYDVTPPATASGATYMKVTVSELGTAHFYTVPNAKTLLIMNEPAGGDKELTLYDGSANNDFDPVTITIPAITKGKIYAFGPYGAFAMDMSGAIGLDLPVSSGDDGAYNVTGSFYNMQWHVINQGTPPDTAINWYPTNIVTADAVYIEAAATKDDNTQEAGAWSIDTSPRVSSVDDDGTVNYRLEVFFGNDTVTLSPPTYGKVTGVAVRTASDSPGYSFEDVSGAVKVTFHSDYYDYITVPLTLTLANDETQSANVTIHRVGVDIQEHRGEGMRQVWHGTQFGSPVDLTQGGFKLTATYYIPDGGNTLPYGLFVTRTYSSGRVETETILVPMGNVFSYVGAANAVDYLIYSGTDAAIAPVSVSVLVLKDEPSNNSFGGVSFGSGLGVTWTSS